MNGVCMCCCCFEHRIHATYKIPSHVHFVNITLFVDPVLQILDAFSDAVSVILLTASCFFREFFSQVRYDVAGSLGISETFKTAGDVFEESCEVGVFVSVCCRCLRERVATSDGNTYRTSK